ncbi:isocitrate lyase/phosphoenolpyruvate mutase family protein [Phenylobacterium sp.]|jgi:2-methylisocitrate lyase-like PEP mutase family enzyme|uniref:isocitrate lyase/PEP mutase family protein n=1 Tax=Phenylobacterium sp. TaxID=1871053 RepID=UPI002E30886F|nr:isocitrate lyase/phosphoenolpyruvate mutase family protein [Phenylobacterium sp.]HEX4709354.1 isocitrate lyase/phosphoenolpyruvate mutase family protein [Phenylobacterium sp.]
MTDQQTRAGTFRALHTAGRPIVLFNVWDPGSAKAVEAAGAAALATGSWSVAAAFGQPDGEHLPLTLALDNLARIVAATDLPVSIDLESGYGEDPAGVGRAVAEAMTVGAIGCNLEDSFPTTGQLRGIEDQVERLRAARAAMDLAQVAGFLNARTDVFFQAPAEAHDPAMVEAALERAHAYAAAGADGIFMPGLADLRLIEIAAKASPLPLNIMAGERTPELAALARVGVARVSHGPGPYLTAMRAVEEAARAAFDGGASAADRSANAA